MAQLNIWFASLLAVSFLTAASAAARSSFEELTSCGHQQQPPPRKTFTERVGGRLVQQEAELRVTAVHGCIWTLPGGNRTNYILAHRCLHVSATVLISDDDGAGGSWRSRLVAPTAADPDDPRLFGKCRLRRSVDCRLHSVAYWDPQLPCPEAEARLCPQRPRLHWRVLGGRNISQTLISLRARAPDGTGSSCEWVLLGGWAGAFTRWAGSEKLPCSRCQKGTDGCAPPKSPPTSPVRIGCINRLGPDCQFYESAIDDPEAACPPPKAAAAAAAASSVVGGGAGSGSSAAAQAGGSAVLTAALALAATANRVLK